VKQLNNFECVTLLLLRQYFGDLNVQETHFNFHG